MTHILDHLIANGPALMGVINVTPDSFSDGGAFLNVNKAIEHGLQLVEEGAAILDIGGESTRPGAAPVSVAEEQDRILPVIEGLKDCGALISVDTRNADTMRTAIEAGAGMINDVTALSDPESVEVAKSFDGPVCLMHMQGQPQSMQDNPHYDDVVEEVFGFLQQRIESCGIGKDRLIADPGIGFGKTLDHNLQLLKNLDRFHDLGVPILLGTSRKSFIEKIINNIPHTPHPTSARARAPKPSYTSPLSPAQDTSAACAHVQTSGGEGGGVGGGRGGGVLPDQRLPGSLSSALWGVQKGASILRVHDVAQTRQALEVFQALAA